MNRVGIDFAGVSDKYSPFVIESFVEAKYILRQYIQSQCKIHDWISGLSINVTSTVTQSALKVRPYANTEYWLSPSEFVRSLNERNFAPAIITKKKRPLYYKALQEAQLKENYRLIEDFVVDAIINGYKIIMDF